MVLVAIYSILSADGLPINSVNKFHKNRRTHGLSVAEKIRSIRSADVNNVSKHKQSTLNSNSDALLNELSMMDSKFGDMDDDHEYGNYNDEIAGVASRRPHDQINQEDGDNDQQHLYDDYEYDQIDAESNEDELLRKYYGLPLRRAVFDDFEFSDDIKQMMRAETIKRESPFLKQLTANDDAFDFVMENDDDDEDLNEYID